MNARLICGAGLLVLVMNHLLAAAPPIESLLPISTKEFVAIPSISHLEAAWERTNFGKLFRDPLLKSFRESLGPTSWLPGAVCTRLKLTPGEIREMAGGGAGWAFSVPAPGQAAQIVWIDTTGKGDARSRWIETCTARLKKSGGKAFAMTMEGADGFIYETARGERVYSVVRDELLLLCDEKSALEGVLGRWNSKGGDSLQDLPAYLAVQKRLGDTSNADLRLFVEPLGRVEVQRFYHPMNPGKGQGKDRDLIATLKKQGVDGIRGVGASIRLATEHHDLHYHVVVQAPPPLRGGLGVLRLTAGDKFTPEPWIPADVASHMTVYLDIPAAFDSFGGLFDEIAPGAKEGTWNEWLKDLKDAPNGPRVDLRKEIINRLQPRVTFFTAPPEQTDRLMTAIPVVDGAAVKRALRSMFENDEGATVKKVLNHDVWVVESLTRKKGQAASRTVFTVADDRFYISNRFDLLESTLRQGNLAQTLAGSEEFKQVTVELDRLVPRGGRMVSRAFARPELDYRTTYEAARQEKLGDLDSLNARLAMILLGTLEEQMTRLPPFGKISGYLKPAGSVALQTEDGWEVHGFSLMK